MSQLGARDRETERQRDREAERQADRKLRQGIVVWLAGRHDVLRLAGAAAERSRGECIDSAAQCSERFTPNRFGF